MTDVLPLREDVPDSLQFGDERIYDYDGDRPVRPQSPGSPTSGITRITASESFE